MSHFYKYCTAATGRIVLQNQTLRWSSPRALNDPADMQFDFRLDIHRDRAIAIGLEKLHRHFRGERLDRPLNQMGRIVRSLPLENPFGAMPPEEFADNFRDALHESLDILERRHPDFNAAAAEAIRNAKVLCLSRSPGSNPMWAHYGGGHTGVVLRFTDATENNPFEMARPVQYVREPPSLFDDETFSDVLAGYEPYGPNWVRDQVIYTKSHHWEYEQEWRISSGYGRSPEEAFEDLRFGSRELDGVILGERISDEDRDAMLALLQAHYPHAEVFRAERHRGYFDMQITRVAL